MCYSMNVEDMGASAEFSGGKDNGLELLIDLNEEYSLESSYISGLEGKVL